MARNYFANRPEDSMYPERLNKGDTVLIIEKENQGTKDMSKLVEGKVVKVLSRSGGKYKNGAKVQIVLSENDHRFEERGYDHIIGRVQYIVKRIDDEENPYFKYLENNPNGNYR